jgi:acetyl esterase/lipase
MALLPPMAALALLAALFPAAGAAYTKQTFSYDLGSPVIPARLNQLDLYAPPGLDPRSRRPLVIFVHGGGWLRGDKGNQIAGKAGLFTSAGYLFASLNYRLSPDPIDLGDSDRVMFPDHPHDVGEAIAWLNRHVSEHGGDPTRMILIGHSAGAHLVSLVATEPSYVDAYGVAPSRIRGVVSLDTAGFDIAARAASANPALYLNAFGTPAENALSDAWNRASPIRFAGAEDPPFLLVTQQRARSGANNRAMAAALGQDPATAVIQVPLDHEGINDAVGAAGDPTGETAAIMSFIRRVTRTGPPGVVIKHHPASRISSMKRRVEVRFAFASIPPGAGFECRLDSGPFAACRSPRTYVVGSGRHSFRVRARVGVENGPAKGFDFVVRRRRG